MLGYESKRSLRKLGPIIDKINILLSILIVGSGIFLIVDIKKYIFMFPVLFALAALMNLLLAFKCYKMAEMGRMVILIISFLTLTVLSVVGFVVTLS